MKFFEYSQLEPFFTEVIRDESVTVFVEKTLHEVVHTLGKNMDHPHAFFRGVFSPRKDFNKVTLEAIHAA